MRTVLALACLATACSSSSSTGGAANDMTASTAPDLSASVDMSPGAELGSVGLEPGLGTVEFGAPDLATPDDLTTRDLAMPDLATPDLAMPDLARPDLATPDLATPDLAPSPDLAPLPDLAPSPDLMPEQFRDRIFAATSYSAATEPVYEITGGTLKQFATVPANGWLGPLVITSDGHFYIASNDQGGSVWDITAGGDFTTGGKTPLVANLFTGNISYIDGMGGDTRGNLYVCNSEHGAQAIAVVNIATKQVTTFGSYDNAEDALAVGSTLYISEGGKGRILAHDLDKGTDTVLATGFVAAEDHISAQLATDFTGHVYTNWKGVNASSTGIYDVTAGGDFSSKMPLVAQTFDVDVNQLAFSSTGDCYVAGASSGNNYVSRRVGGVLQPFQVFVTGVGDNETMAIGH